MLTSTQHYIFDIANINSNGSRNGNGKGIGIPQQPREYPYMPAARQAARQPGEFVFVIAFDIDMWFTFCLSTFCMRTLCQP